MEIERRRRRCCEGGIDGLGCEPSPRAGTAAGKIGLPEARDGRAPPRAKRSRWRRGVDTVAGRRCGGPGEPVHPRVAVDLASGVLIVNPAKAPGVLDRRRATAATRSDVIELDLV